MQDSCVPALPCRIVAIHEPLSAGILSAYTAAEGYVSQFDRAQAHKALYATVSPDSAKYQAFQLLAKGGALTAEGE